MDPWRGNSEDKCHLHPKPILSCKYCRKYKLAVHQQAKIAHVHQLISGLTPNPHNVKQDTLEMTSNVNYNLNPMLKENIVASEYFKSLYQLNNVNDLIREADQYIDHVEPYVTGHSNVPSTFICCLYKLCQLKCTENEMFSITEHENLYVRALGYVWLRFVYPPDKLWTWFEKSVLCGIPFHPSGPRKPAVPFGEFLETVLKDDRYFSTPLPRLPVKVKSQLMQQLEPLPQHRQRKIKNLQYKSFRPGVEVLACHKGEWKEGIYIDKYEDDISQEPLAMVKFEDQELEEHPIDFGLIINMSSRKRKHRVR